jgi:endonuclease YncB( thermonuclease family)
MWGGWSGVLAASVAAGSAFVWGHRGVAAQERPAALLAPGVPCGGSEIARGGVSLVLDGGNVVLDDGRVVHLAAIEVPLLPPAGVLHIAPGGAVARAALVAFLNGGPIVVRRAESESDRYGRIVGYVESLRPGAAGSAEAALLSAGFARVSTDVSDRACAAELLRRENIARKARIGLWADPYYDPIPADKPADILTRRGRFALVEGNVVSVHESGATVYLNFGRRWSEDFAVTIRKRNERNFTAAGLQLKSLADRSLRVRGWIEAHAGDVSGTGEGPWRAPWIEATNPAQIELIGNDEMRVTR